MADDSDLDRFVGSFVFEVTIEGMSGYVNGGFTRVSGISSESEQLAWMQGTDRSVNTAPGKVKYADITLERVFAGRDAFYNWRRRVELGLGISSQGDDPYRKNVEIRLYKRDRYATKDLSTGTLVRHMSLKDAWPSRWQLPDLDANSSTMAIETIVLTVRDIVENVVADKS
jgi:phage tail-like protein